jgi:hypothetical protein
MSDAQWQQFPRHHDETYGYGRLEIQIEDYDPVSETRTVCIVLNEYGYEGRKAAFYAHPNPHDRYTIELQGIVWVAELSTEEILAVVDDILKNGKLWETFVPPDEEANCHE